MTTKSLLLLVMACLPFCPRWAAGAEEATTNQHPSASVYVLRPNDQVHLKVYQEDDLETKVRIGQDGTASFPLIGVVKIEGKTVEEAAGLIRELLDKDYLVNPQVTLSVLEYSKRRFTVLGQVQKPGSIEMPDGPLPDLLQAVAMAGGYTRLADPSRVTVTRMLGERKVSYTLDAKAAARDPKTKPFKVFPDDTITVAERWW